MELRGKLNNILYNKEGHMVISFEINTPANPIDFGDTDLDIKVVQYKEKRSLNANNYAWVLISQIARELKSSAEEIYENFIRQVAYYETDANENVIEIVLRKEIDIGKITGHWLYIGDADSDGDFKTYLMLRGSSDFNTKEMADFIDLVVDTAKELGIETLTPRELESMKAAWNEKCISK